MTSFSFHLWGALEGGAGRDVCVCVWGVGGTYTYVISDSVSFHTKYLCHALNVYLSAVSLLSLYHPSLFLRATGVTHKKKEQNKV